MEANHLVWATCVIVKLKRMGLTQERTDRWRKRASYERDEVRLGEYRSVPWKVPWQCST